MTKFKDRGFWVSQHFYWQSLLHYYWYSARFRSFTFFAALNPAIEMGGMLDESKMEIYRLLPQKWVPLTLVKFGTDVISEEEMRSAGLHFPVIIKPDIGFKGYMVVKVDNLKEANQFLDIQESNRIFLIQEFLDYSREFSLLYYKIPGTDEAGITSLVEKIYPYIIGDGIHSLKWLISRYMNPFMDRKGVINKWKDRLNWIPTDGKKVVLDQIGNYARGSKFYALQDKIDQALVAQTMAYFANVNGIEFFRMDFKSNSLEDYKNGDFKILEINGAKSEPIHIYDPSQPFITNVKTIYQHWKLISRIVKARKSIQNYQFPTTREGLKALKSVKKLVPK